MEDRCGVTRGEVSCPVIWSCWHNRILLCPVAFNRFCPKRRASVLTSSSKDGAMLAGVMTQFGLGNVRGSSSRRGGAALREMVSTLEAGGDIVISPDGPRGPVYKLGPGMIKLAQLTGAPIVPVHIRYSRFWQLKSWDGFRIPKPFSRVDFILGALHEVSAYAEGGSEGNHSGDAFEAERARLETVLVEGNAVKPASRSS